MDVDVLLYDGFDELDAVGPFEVFGYAADEGADLDTRLVSLDGPGTVTASHGLRVEAENALADPGELDLLVVPGGGWNDRSEAGAWAEYERGDVPEAIAAHHEAGATVASVCTGGMLLSKAGLLAGQPAVTHRGAVEDLRETDADVRNERVVDDGDVLTAGGVTSGIDLALHLVEREAGAEIADAVATVLEYERQHEAYSP